YAGQWRGGVAVVGPGLWRGIGGVDDVDDDGGPQGRGDRYGALRGRVQHRHRAGRVGWGAAAGWHRAARQSLCRSRVCGSGDVGRGWYAQAVDPRHVWMAKNCQPRLASTHGNKTGAFRRPSALHHHTLTRLSGARYSFWPSFTSNAGYQASMLRTVNARNWP